MGSRANLDARIHRILAENERHLGVAKDDERDVSDRFISLIQAAEARFGQHTVIIVDEYGKPILDNLASPDLAREMRDELRNLYSVIKGQDAHIKFAMLTGVSKFSKVNQHSPVSIWTFLLRGRCYDSAPNRRWKTITMLSSIHLDGTTKCVVFEGVVDRKMFNEYIKKGLVPSLQPSDIVIMDNLSAHKSQNAYDKIKNKQADFQFLPAYSPDFNPIEKMWSKVKQVLRDSLNNHPRIFVF